MPRYPTAYRSNAAVNLYNDRRGGFQSPAVQRPSAGSSGGPAQVLKGPGGYRNPYFDRPVDFKPLVDFSRRPFGLRPSQIGLAIQIGRAVSGAKTNPWIIALDLLKSLLEIIKERQRDQLLKLQLKPDSTWTLGQICSGFGGPSYFDARGAPGASGTCYILQGTATPANQGVRAGDTFCTVWSTYPVPGSLRSDSLAVYTRPFLNSLKDGGMFWQWAEQFPTDVRSGYRPSLAPLAQPIGQVVPNPEPIPYRTLPHRGIDPMWQTPDAYEGGNVAPNDDPYREPIVSPTPYYWPPYETTPVVGPLAPPPHSFDPPPPRTRERKFIFAASGVVAKVVDAVTETNDFVDALYGALPAKDKPKKKLVKDEFGRWHVVKPTLQQKILTIYTHFRDLKLGKALEGYFRNQLGDAIGGIHGRASKLYQRKVHSVGGHARNPFISRIPGVGH